MASAFVVARPTKDGRRYHVRYRLGGRSYPVQHGGSFATLKEARQRRDVLGAELAHGRNPRELLDTLTAVPPAPVTLHGRFDEFIASRVDVGDSTRALYRNARDRLRSLSNMQPDKLTAADVQAWIADNLRDAENFPALKKKSLEHYLSTLRQVLDFCEVTPNPARSKLVRLPAEVSEEVAPPSFSEWQAMKANLPKRISLVARFIECEGVRVSEALQLTYGDLDFAGGRVRISMARTKGRTAGQRWLPVPQELLEEISDLVPLEDRHADRRVFADITDARVRDGLSRACRDAGIAAYSPHGLRHRRISLWIAQGIDAVQAKTWAGHSKTQMTLDVYAHVVIDSNADEWREFWRSTYVQGRAGGVRVVSRTPEYGGNRAARANATLQES